MHTPTSTRLGRTGRLAARLWEALRWPVLVTGAAVSLVLGYIGYRQFLIDSGSAHAILDVLYLDLRLFSADFVGFGGSTEIGWELDVARWLAPAVLLASAVKGFGYLFRDQIRLMMLSMARDHIVVVGAGHKGLLLARSLIADGYRVVVVERDASTELVEACRLAGATVVTGDARSELVLNRARIKRARHLLVVCGDQGTNVEVAARASQLVRDEPGPSLTCLVHIVDARLCRLLRADQLGSESSDRFRLDFFNVYETGARALLHDYPVHLAANGTVPCILVVGLSELGRAVIIRAAREWRAANRSGPDGEERLVIIGVDAGASEIVAAMHRRFPRLSQFCEIHAHDIDPESPAYERGTFLEDTHFRAAFICVDGDAASLAAALNLYQYLADPSIPVVVASTTDGGLSSLSHEYDGNGHFGTVQAFRLLNRTCVPEVLLGGAHEVIARSMHEEYVRHHTADGLTAADNPSLVPWDDLPESLKESNRSQAAHIGTKLSALGCQLAPLADWNAESFRFDDDEMELLAEMEHERWESDNRRAGWTFDPGPRDAERKTSPWLIPWDDLPAAEKEKDRIFIRRLPTFLADIGFEINRTESPAPGVAAS